MTGDITGARGDAVEDFLDRLLVSLSGSPRRVRHTLSEVEAHLRDAVDEGVAAGLSEPEAQEWAVERMGPVHTVTGGPAIDIKQCYRLGTRVRASQWCPNSTRTTRVKSVSNEDPTGAPGIRILRRSCAGSTQLCDTNPQLTVVSARPSGA